jgi:uncharacterized protein with ATP-grasp and redox domains
MRVHPDCLPCFARQIHSVCALLPASPAQRLDWSRQAMWAVLEADWERAPPEVSGLVQARLCELSGVEDPYLEAKRLQNDYLLARLPALEARVRAAPDPLAAALRLSMAGNLIDLGVNPEVSAGDIDAAIEEAFALGLDRALVERFEAEVAGARRILFLADNSGEIVFDRLLLEALPREKIVVAVRGRPILNDVTLREAEQVGLLGRVEVVANGAGVPGTALAQCSEELRRLFDSADLVISKGQGNFETLFGLEKPIWFLFKIKCAVVQEALGEPLGSLVFHRQAPGAGATAVA